MILRCWSLAVNTTCQTNLFLGLHMFVVLRKVMCLRTSRMSLLDKRFTLSWFEVRRHFTENSDIQHSQHSATTNLKQFHKLSHNHSKMATEHSIKYNIFLTFYRRVQLLRVSKAEASKQHRTFWRPVTTSSLKILTEKLRRPSQKTKFVQMQRNNNHRSAAFIICTCTTAVRAAANVCSACAM